MSNKLNDEEYFITMIRNSNSYAESLGHMKEYKRRIALLQRTLTIKTFKENTSEYPIGLINQMIKARLE